MKVIKTIGNFILYPVITAVVIVIGASGDAAYAIMATGTIIVLWLFCKGGTINKIIASVIAIVAISEVPPLLTPVLPFLGPTSSLNAGFLFGIINGVAGLSITLLLFRLFNCCPRSKTNPSEVPETRRGKPGSDSKEGVLKISGEMYADASPDGKKRIVELLRQKKAVLIS